MVKKRLSYQHQILYHSALNFLTCVTNTITMRLRELNKGKEVLIKKTRFLRNGICKT